MPRSARERKDLVSYQTSHIGVREVHPNNKIERRLPDLPPINDPV